MGRYPIANPLLDVPGAFDPVNFVNPFWTDLDPETVVWRDLAISAAGTFESNSIALADALIKAIKAATFNTKIKWLLPLLGGNQQTARIVLRDAFGVGFAANTGFVDANFSQSTGLQGANAKYLDLRFKLSQLGTGGNGGIGYWENNISFAGTGVEPMGAFGTNGSQKFAIDLRGTFKGMFWGTGTGFAKQDVAATNGHYYAQRSSSTSRKLYFNGSNIATDTDSDGTTGIDARNAQLLGLFDATNQTYWHGRCACAYATDGTLTDGEISDLHTLLQTYLITPTGR